MLSPELFGEQAAFGLMFPTSDPVPRRHWIGEQLVQHLEADPDFWRPRASTSAPEVRRLFKPWRWRLPMATWMPALALVLALPVVAAPLTWSLTGTVRVVDGDTLEVTGERVRFEGGVDAPERDQLCRRASGAEYHCGAVALLALEDRIAGRQVTCRGEGRDRYGRLLGRCEVGGEDLGTWLVGSGWAVVDRRYGVEYVPQETAAARRRLGLWQGTFEAPSAWRRARR